MKQKVINLYGGPGTGKSTTAAMLFAKMKLAGINCEYVPEFAKDLAWEFSSNSGDLKALLAQEYVFAQQHFRMRRCSGEVEYIITDSPLLMSKVYIQDDFELPSLYNVIDEAYAMYDNIDILLNRVKPYNPKGRFQCETEARIIDDRIKHILPTNHFVMDASDSAATTIFEIIKLTNYQK